MYPMASSSHIPLQTLSSGVSAHDSRSILRYDRDKRDEDVELLPPIPHPSDADFPKSPVGGAAPHLSSRRRPSFRLFVIHALHAILLALNLFILAVSIRHSEHKVAVSIDRVSEVASYISVAFQIFFTASILVLYLLSSSVAVDSAIRHPRTIVDLDIRLYAWSGLGSSITNLYSQFSRLKSLPLSISIGIPLYFIAGEVLKVTSSTVLGVAVYNSTSQVSPNSSVTNHVAAFSYPGLSHPEYGPYQLEACDDLNPGHDLGLWRAARASLFLPTVNNTLRPGIQGRMLHDTPLHVVDAFDTVHVNSTRMSVECSQVDDAFVEYFLVPFGTSNKFLPTGITVASWDYGTFPIGMKNTTVIHADADGYTVQKPSTDRYTTISESWLNISIPTHPPYWEYFWSQQTSGFPFSQLATVIDGDLVLAFQPWGYSDPSRTIGGGMGTYGPGISQTGISHQMVFAVSTTNPSLLLVDGAGRQGKVHNVSRVFGECAASCTKLDGQECFADAQRQNPDGHCTKTNFVQVLGCTLRTSQETLAITQAGLLSTADSSKEKAPAAHPWTSFSWEDPDDNSDFLAKEFLTMLVPATCATVALLNGDTGAQYRQHDTQFMKDMLISGLKANGSTVQNLENTLELLSASYLWNVRQLCTSPPYGTAYEAFNSTALDENPQRFNTATFVMVQTKARLEIVQWKAVVTAICSVILFVLAFLLLGTTTDLPKDKALRESRFIENVMLMKDSMVPEVIETPGSAESVRLRYGPRRTGDGYNIDVTGR